jgi:hypothetical protein
MTYSILNGNSNETIIVRINDGRHILDSVTDSITTAVDPYENWEVGRIRWSIHV